MKSIFTLTKNCLLNGPATAVRFVCALLVGWSGYTSIGYSQAVDPSFTPPLFGYVFGLALQPDGSILVGGFAGIQRLKPDGATDASFDAGLTEGGEVYGVAVQSDGRIVIAGSFHSIHGQARTNLARLNFDGSLDTTFGFQAGTYPDEWVDRLAIQDDGKILLAGSFNRFAGQAPRWFLRLNTDGTVDNSFHPAYIGIPTALAVQPDGKILVGTLGVERLNPDGSTDSSFHPVQGNMFSAISMALQPDGKIILVGDFTTLNGQPRVRIGRLQPDGTLDAPFGSGANGTISSIALQTDGRVLVSGAFTEINGKPRTRVARLHADGSLDEGFGMVADTDVAYLALQPDGKILAAGFFGNPGGFQTINVKRFLNVSPAVQRIEIADRGSRVNWIRGGSATEVQSATFEFSGDGTHYGVARGGTRVPGGWEFAGLPPLSSGQTIYIRARGRVAGLTGGGGTSSGLIESVQGFSVVTVSPRELIRQVAMELESLRGDAGSPQDRAKLKVAASDLNRAVSSALWLDDTHVDARHDQRLFHELEKAIRTLEGLQHDRHGGMSAAELQSFIDRLVGAAQLIESK